MGMRGTDTRYWVLIFYQKAEHDKCYDSFSNQWESLVFYFKYSEPCGTMN